MAVTINGTTGIATPDGSAGTPPYTGASGATNGLYFPTATSAAIATNGTNAVTISSAQVVSLANALPVASGGTGVTTSTGSGAVVLGTTPTFTTSALFPAGTVSAPGIAASGDTNTGIYFPAADTLAFATNGTEDGRFDSVGNLLLNSATLSPTQTSGGSVAMTGTLAMGSSFKRNRIINGNMVVDQRATAATTNTTYTVDRWRFNKSNDATESVAQNSDAPTGFSYSVRNTISAGDASIGATQYSGIQQPIEGYNIADLGFGTASAKSVTLSFWAKATQTGTYSACIHNSAANRLCWKTFTINASNTWEYKTLTFVGDTDTSATWLTTNGLGLMVYFLFALGSSYSGGTDGVWNTQYYGPSGMTNGIGTNGNIYAITGVQLEVGSVATPYERQIYSDQLAQCQRYLPAIITQSGNAGDVGVGVTSSTSAAAIFVPFMVAPRVAPTGITVTNVSSFTFTTVAANSVVTAITFANGSLNGSRLNCTGTGTPYISNSTALLYGNGSATVGSILFNGCEL